MKPAPAFERHPSWHIAQSEHVREATAAEELAYRGFEVYYPIFMTSVRQNYFKRRNVSRPFFPGYLFVCIDKQADAEWERIYSIRGIAGMLKAPGDRLAIVPDAAISAVRDKEAELTKQFEASIRKGKGNKVALPFKAGDKVIVDDDLWRYQLGTIERLDAHGRITVLLSLFGRVTRVEVSANQVRVV